MQLKLLMTGHKRQDIRVIDPETGETVRGIKRLLIEADASDGCTITMEVADVQIDADFELPEDFILYKGVICKRISHEEGETGEST